VEIIARDDQDSVNSTNWQHFDQANDGIKRYFKADYSADKINKYDRAYQTYSPEDVNICDTGNTAPEICYREKNQFSSCLSHKKSPSDVPPGLFEHYWLIGANSELSKGIKDMYWGKTLKTHIDGAK
jgi:hypothetical protein